MVYIGTVQSLKSPESTPEFTKSYRVAEGLRRIDGHTATIRGLPDLGYRRALCSIAGRPGPALLVDSLARVLASFRCSTVELNGR